MKTFGLIGYPLGHSFSKKFFEEKFNTEKISDAAYELFPMENISSFPTLVENTKTLCGLNVTVPHKKTVMKFLNEISDTAIEIGAVNCISISKKKIVGYNTDAPAFEKSLTPYLKTNHHAALILGNGGSAAAVKFVLKRLNIPFQIVTRNPKHFSELSWQQVDEAVVKFFPLIINTTPLGMFPASEFFPAIPYSALTQNHLLFDLVYNPNPTEFLKQGMMHGASIVSGLQMFHVQAELSWQIWNNSNSDLFATQ